MGLPGGSFGGWNWGSFGGSKVGTFGGSKVGTFGGLKVGSFGGRKLGILPGQLGPDAAITASRAKARKRTGLLDIGQSPQGKG
jgi:hypothetical protein